MKVTKHSVIGIIDVDIAATLSVDKGIIRRKEEECASACSELLTSTARGAGDVHRAPSPGHPAARPCTQ